MPSERGTNAPSAANTGGCLCGAIRYRALGRPRWVAHCHCRSCRRNTGAAVATFLGYGQDRFAYTKGRPKTFNSSPGVERGFCDRCGSPLTYRADRYPGEVHVYVSTLDDPDAFPPTLHVHTGEQLSWLHIADDLPRHHGTSRDSGTAP